MTLVFPRDMISAECWETAKFTLQHRQELSRTAGGVVQGKDLGPAIWMAEFQSYPLAQAEAEALEADMQTLGGVVRTFYAVTMRRRAPFARSGEALTGVTIASTAISGNYSSISLAGLPSGFVMTAADFVTVTTSTGTELLRLVRGGTADGTGVTPLMEVVPYLRPASIPLAIQPADPVTLIDPYAEMRLEPGSLETTRHSRRRWRVGIRAQQVIR